MKKSTLVLLAALSLSGAKAQKLVDGDIIFIQNKALEGKDLLPTGKSKFNYLGVIFHENGIPYVYHAAASFTRTPLEEFRKMATGDAFTKHLEEEEMMGPDVIKAMKSYANAKLGSPYDNRISLVTEDLYNAEFAWKVYQSAIGLSLCQPKPLKDYKFNSSLTIEFLKEAYGPAVMDEPIVTVGDIYNSKFLE